MSEQNDIDLGRWAVVGEELRPEMVQVAHTAARQEPPVTSATAREWSDELLTATIERYERLLVAVRWDAGRRLPYDGLSSAMAVQELSGRVGVLRTEVERRQREEAKAASKRQHFWTRLFTIIGLAVSTISAVFSFLKWWQGRH